MRQRWAWAVAETLNRAGWCWSDLVDWALDHHGAPDRRLRDVGRRSTCAREALDSAVTSTLSCYCGQVGPKSPGTARRIARRRRWIPGVRRVALAGAALAAVAGLAAVPAPTRVLPSATSPGSSGVVEVPCRPVVARGVTECRYEVDARRLSGARVVVLAPAPVPSARMVREQIRDARGGTP